MKITPFFRWYDLWVGAYYDRGKALYICPIPMFGIKIGPTKTEVGDILTAELEQSPQVDPERYAKLETLLERVQRLEAALVKAISYIKPHHALCANRQGCNFISAVTGQPDCIACDEWQLIALEGGAE